MSSERSQGITSAIFLHAMGGPKFIVDGGKYVAGALEAEAWRRREVAEGEVVHIVLAKRRLVEGLLAGHLSPSTAQTSLFCIFVGKR